MAAFLYRFEGEPEGPFDAPEFSDVPAGSTFATEVAWLASTGITLGRTDGSFGVADPVTRGAMAAFLYRYDAYERGDQQPAPDPDPDPDIDDPDETRLIVTFVDVGGAGFSDPEGILFLCDPDGIDCVARSSGVPDADGVLELPLVAFAEEAPGLGSVQWFATIDGEQCSGVTERFLWPADSTVELTAEIGVEEARWCGEQ